MELWRTTTILLVTASALGTAAAEPAPLVDECDEQRLDCCPIPYMPTVDFDQGDLEDCWEELLRDIPAR